MIGPLPRGVSVFLCSVFCALCSVLPTDPRVWASRGMYCPESEWEDSERQVEDSIKAGSKKKERRREGGCTAVYSADRIKSVHFFS